MARFLDNLAATFVIFLLTLAVGVYLSGQLVTGLVIALLIALIFNLCLQSIHAKTNDKKCSSDNLYRYILKNGNEAVCAVMMKLLPATYAPSCDGNMITIQNNGKKELIFSNYKFGTTTSEDIARFGRTATKQGAQKVDMLGRSIERNAIAFGQTYGRTEFVFITHKKFYSLLRKKKMLPDIPKTEKRKRSVLKEILALALSRSNFKRYLFSGLMLTICSFLVFALKIYYLSGACVCFWLALLCLTGIGTKVREGKNGIFDELDKKDDSPQEPPKHI